MPRTYGRRTPSGRVRHEAVFEAGWEADQVLPRQRTAIEPEHRLRDRALDVAVGARIERGQQKHPLSRMVERHDRIEEKKESIGNPAFA